MSELFAIWTNMDNGDPARDGYLVGVDFSRSGEFVPYVGIPPNMLPFIARVIMGEEQVDDSLDQFQTAA